MNWVAKYAREINAGKIVASKRVQKIYTRMAEEIKYSRSHKRSKYRFDEELGQRPIDFIEQFCRQSQGDFGAPIKLELFQKAFIQVVFGFVHRKTGLRRFREAMVLMGRKNGKTTLLAGLALYMMIADGEGAAEIYSVATKRDQAAIALNQAVNMRSHSPEIAALTKKRRNDIYFPMTASYFTALASESKTLDGLNVHAAIIDELHAIRDRGIYDVVKQGTSNRRQPLVVMITTAGTLRENIFDSTYEYACKVADGDAEDEAFLPILYELDSREEWTDPACWMKANPGLGTIKQRETLVGFVERAKKNPEDLPGVLCKDFNIRETEAVSWLRWEDIESELTFDMTDIYDTYAIGGCDLSATTDLTSATLLIRKPNDNHVYVLQHYFIPEARVKKVETSGDKEAPYRAWAERGLLTICSGNRVKFSAVTAWFCQMRDQHKIEVMATGYDRALAGYWVDEMEANGFEMVKVAQGAFTWSQPMKEMGAAFADKVVNYNKNPVLAWCLSNTGVKKSGTLENIQPVKISAKRRIDGTVSLLNSWVVYIQQHEDFMYRVG